MSISIKIEGSDRVRKAFADLKKKAKNAEVSVGYTANYAIYVHEMVGAAFKAPGTGAKFLEEPLRNLSKELVDLVAKAINRGATLEQGLLIAGLRLQRESQQRCPIDTGNLRASAFTRLEKTGAS